MPNGPISDEQVRKYHDEGYVVAKNFFEIEEIERSLIRGPIQQSAAY